ncbi:MAG: alpha/beta fold hydrolase, partial [Defluviitaleaceae bacterium]|nr:alpha/beta fold hydrolase [Defluviitaleaceae bacterium]
MKKLLKLIAFAAFATAAAALINHLIFKTAKPPARSRLDRREYKWRHGRLRYVVAGKGEPILLLHGLEAGSSSMEWEELIASFARGYRVYAFDFLGYGESSKPNITYSAYLFASQINAFISDVIGSAVNVVASSKSGTIAMAACALKPELYNKMLLVSPAINTRSACEGWMLRTLVNMPIKGTAFYNILTSRLYFRWLLRKNLALPLDSPDEMFRGAHAGGVGNKYPMAACFSDMMTVDLDAITHGLSLPIHVCWGALNASNPLDN